jgi:hypothetical protein
MMQGLLGRDWKEVILQLERMGKPYTFQISHPHGKMEGSGSCRVVRVREFDDRVEVVIVYEKFSPRQS